MRLARLFVCGFVVWGCEALVGIEQGSPLTADSGSTVDASGDEVSTADAAEDVIEPKPQPIEHVPCDGTDCVCEKEPVAGAENETYKDVRPTNIEAPAVAALHEAAIIGGCDDSPPLFCPLCQLSRGAIVKWLVAALKAPLIDPAVPSFTDVPRNHPLYEYIETAYSLDIVDGYLPDGTFRPDNPLSRGVAAVMIFRALKLPEPAPPTPSYEDVSANHFAYAAVEALRAECITTGCTSDGQSFCPGTLLTRRSGAVLVARAFELVERECAPDPSER